MKLAHTLITLFFAFYLMVLLWVNSVLQWSVETLYLDLRSEHESYIACKEGYLEKYHAEKRLELMGKLK